MKICIDPGHGGKDPGAVSNGIKEKNIALGIATTLANKLREKSLEVYMTRTSDTYDTPFKKAEKGNLSKSDLFVSIHCNSANSITAHGTEVLIYDINGVNEVLANNILCEVVKNLGTADRGIKLRPELDVLKHTEMTAVLVETAFISNSRERDLLVYRQNDFATSIAKGIFKYLGIDVEEKEVEFRYNNINEVPSWAKGAVQKLIDKGKFADVNKLDLSYDMVRMIVIFNR